VTRSENITFHHIQFIGIESKYFKPPETYLCRRNKNQNKLKEVYKLINKSTISGRTFLPHADRQ